MVENKSKWLIVTEKPSVAADIAKSLGGFDKQKEYYESDDYYLTWAIGHLLEFLEPEELDPKYKRWLLSDLPILPNTFQYKPKKGQAERLSVIKSLAKKTSVAGFINGCDAGREGELIFREIIDYCEQDKPFKRIWLQSMTGEAIKKAFSQLKKGTDFNPLADAARCRAESDWLIGMNGTRALTKRLKTRSTKGVWSIGRVQTPTLALLVKRELEYLDHRPEPYFTITGHFAAPNHEYVGAWFDPNFKKNESSADDSNPNAEKEDRIFSEKKLKEILADIEKNKHKTFATETRKESKEIAPGLFDLTLLQRESNRKFGMSALRTLQAAQRLYERYKLLTYPRTDSRFLPEDYLQNVHEIFKDFSEVKNEFSPFCKKVLKTGLLNKERIFNDKFVSDHFAIIPTGKQPSVKLEGDDARIFELVLKRFIASFMPHAVWDKVERITEIGENYFRTRVQDLNVPGWREVYGLDSDEQTKLPKLNTSTYEKEPTSIKVNEIKPEENATKPPPRHSEAKLLSLMEHCGKSVEDEEIAAALKDKGIGTPATRADIIENLIVKEYVVRFGKALKATSKGIRLLDVLNRIPVDILAKVELTGEMESQLKEIEKNLYERKEFMKNMKTFTTQIVERARTFNYDDIYKNEKALGACPECKKGQVFESFWAYACNKNNPSTKTKKDKETETPIIAQCKFIIWKEKNGRYMNRSLVQDLLTHKIIGPIEFPQMSGGGTYEEFLTLAPERGAVFCTPTGEIKESDKKEALAILHEETIPQTFFGAPGLLKVNERFYMCEIQSGPRKKITSRMPRILCTREMTLNEYKNFVITGATEPITDFKSKKGRTFAAMIKLKQNGNFEFKFIAKDALNGNKKEVSDKTNESETTKKSVTDKKKKPKKTIKEKTKKVKIETKEKTKKKSSVKKSKKNEDTL